MMEEVSDDTNGESTFEFVGGKGEESLPKVDETSYPTPFLMESKPSIPLAEAPASESIPHFAHPQTSSSGIGGPSSIPFYDPTQHVIPSATPVPMSPPLQGSNPAAFQNIYGPQGYSQPTEFRPAPGMYHSYSAQEIAHSSLSLPMGNAPAEFPVQSSSETGVWGWLKGKDFLNKVAEKAKSSVDSVITTLDPGMKEIINTGGDINVVVASKNETKISAVREAFQVVFGKATVQGVDVQSSSIAPQPVGFSAGLKAAEERISNLRQQGLVHDQHVLLGIENFLVEITPENWFDIGCLLLQDFSSGIHLQVYTQAIPVASQYVHQAKDQTPSNYPLGWSGFAVTIGQVLGPALGVHHSEWHQGLTGISRREMLLLAAKTIAGMYKAQLRR